MGCNDISNTCGEFIFSTCVQYEGPLGENTKIEEDCVNQHNVNEDLYAITDEIIDGLDTSALGELCLTYPVTEGKIFPKSVFEVHEVEICDLKDRVTVLEGFDYSTLNITGFNLDFKCLVDPCGDPIETLGQLLQIMIDKDCE